MWLLAVLPRICPETDCISGPLSLYASMQLPGVGKYLCLGRFWHVTTPDEIWAMPNNSITAWHFFGNSRNCFFSAAGFYARDWIFPCSFFPFSFSKWLSLLLLLEGTQPNHIYASTHDDLLCREGSKFPLWLLLFRWSFSATLVELIRLEWKKSTSTAVWKQQGTEKDPLLCPAIKGDPKDRSNGNLTFLR